MRALHIGTPTQATSAPRRSSTADTYRFVDEIGEHKVAIGSTNDQHIGRPKPSKREKRLARNAKIDEPATPDGAALQDDPSDPSAQDHPVWSINSAAYTTASRFFDRSDGDESKVRWIDTLTVSVSRRGENTSAMRMMLTRPLVSSSEASDSRE